MNKIGNSMQAVGAIEQLEKESEIHFSSIGVIGSWIQATGSVLSLIGQIKEEIEEIALNIRE